MKTFFICLFIVIVGSSCNHGNPTKGPQPGDSVDVLNLLKDTYRWHDKNLNSLTDFSVIVKDSVQVGLNYDTLKATMNALKQTNYFSVSFHENYKKIADFVNNKV